MTRPLVVLVRGHAPGHGASHGKWSEYDALPEYMIAAELRLRARGVDVIRLELGTLADRQRRGIEAIAAHRNAYPAAPCVYVSCHLNAGGLEYQRSVIFFDARSQLGASTAQRISGRLAEAMGWPSSVRAASATAGGAPSRAYACIGQVYAATPSNCCAVLVEGASVDREPLSTAILRRIGHALGDGLAAHLGSMT